jgi:hypothetical protein|tara:strand:- start:509 stop:700 length:192 start_codon:yes stop_codon:yes gene_type:complete
MINENMWAIKEIDTGKMASNKWGRTLWRTKPTNAMNSILFKHIKNGGLVCVQVSVKETGEVDD